MSDEYILVNIEQGRSQLNGGDFWRLTFQSVEDGATYEMSVDPAYNNFKRSGWNQVVTDEYPYGVYTGLRRTARRTRSGTPVVNADGRARIIYRCENDEELAQLVQALTDSVAQPQNTFQELFSNE